MKSLTSVKMQIFFEKMSQDADNMQEYHSRQFMLTYFTALSHRLMW